MKATLESTSKLVTVDGVPARVWEGTTERGARIAAFITRVTPVDGSTEEFDRDLLECRPPSAELDVFPARLIL